MVQLVVVGLVL